MEPVWIVSTVVLWLVVLANLLLTLALVRRMNANSASAGTDHQPHVGLKKGDTAPDFKAHTLLGEPVTLASYTSKHEPVALLVIGPDCGPCRESLPRYQALYPKALRAGTQLVLVSIGDAASTQVLVEEFKITMPILVATQTENSFFNDYKLRGTPSYYLLDGQGKVQSGGYPNFNGGDWKQLVESWEAPNLQGSRLATTERG
jgi:peroxiredoxin